MKYNYRILDILLDNIPTSESSGVDFEQYFSFVQVLFEETYQKKEGEN